MHMYSLPGYREALSLASVLTPGIHDLDHRRRALALLRAAVAALPPDEQRAFAARCPPGMRPKQGTDAT